MGLLLLPFKILWVLVALPAKLLAAIIEAPFKMVFGGSKKGAASFGTNKPNCPKCGANKSIAEYAGAHFGQKHKHWYCNSCRYAF